MAKTVADSELFYEEVKNFFWRKEEVDFIVRFSDAPMAEWEMIHLPENEMFWLRHRFCEEGAEYAGFGRAEGRYCFYFVDQNIIKTQNLDNGEVEYFNVHAFSEFDLAKVAEELEMLAQQLNQGS
jgi:hypothetical protein